MTLVAAVDVGGTSFKGALIDAQGRTLFTDSSPTLGLLGEAVWDRLTDFLDRLMAVGDVRPEAIGIITPGMDEQTGRVLFSSNLGWRDLPVAERLSARFGLPVAPGHDVGTAGLAESLLGAARGVPDFALVMIGTGIAASLFSRGQRIAGAARMGGEVGHAPVYPGGETCPCGQVGCLEAYASAASIARRYRAQGGAEALTAAEISARLGTDPIAAKVWGEATEALSLSLMTITMLLDPALIVLGGGVAEAGALLLDPVRAGLARRLAWRSPPPIVTSTLGGGGALLGAAILALRKIGQDLRGL
jgi:glucokinase